MLTPLREAAFFARHQFQPLFQIALLYTLPSLAVGLAMAFNEARPEGNSAFVLNIIFLCLEVLQFGAAILYIDARVKGQAITPGRAIAAAAQRLAPLILTNVLMALLVVGGLMLLVVPGLFLAYKLVFAELFLLLHRHNPVDALKASYRATTGLAGPLLPPLVVWLSLVAGASLIPLGSEEGGAEPLLLVIQHLVMAALSIWGWALVYRLYQQHVLPALPVQGA